MKVKVDQKTVDDFQAAANFPSGTLVESRNGKQYLVMAGDNFQPVLVSLENNRVYGTNKIAGAGGSNSYRKILFSQIVLEADWQREESMSGKTRCKQDQQIYPATTECISGQHEDCSGRGPLITNREEIVDCKCKCHEPTPPEGEADPLSPLLDMSVVEGLSEELRKAKAEG